MIPEEPDQALWATRGFEFHFLPLILKPSNMSMFQSMKENIPYPGISRHSESELYCQLPFQRICHGFQHPRAVFFFFFFEHFGSQIRKYHTGDGYTPKYILRRCRDGWEFGRVSQWKFSVIWHRTVEDRLAGGTRRGHSCFVLVHCGSGVLIPRSFEEMWLGF